MFPPPCADGDGSILQALYRHAVDRPDAPAFLGRAGLAPIAPDVTWRELAHRVDNLARRLRNDIPLDRPCLLACPNDPAYVQAFLALLAAGGVAFPIPADSRPTEIDDLLQRIGPATLLTAAPDAFVRHPDAAASGDRPALDVIDLAAFIRTTPAGDATRPIDRSDQAWLMLHSSGTTGQPRIVRRTGPSLAAVARQIAQATGLSPRDGVLGVVPLSHSYGMENGLLTPVVAGAAVTLCRGFEPAAIVQGIGAGRATVLPGVPFIYEIISRRPDDAAAVAKLRLRYSAGANLPAAVRERLSEQFGVHVGQLYGATEIGSVTFGHPDDPAFDPNSVGAPMTGVEIRIVPLPAPGAPGPGSPDSANDAALLPTSGELGQGQVAVRAPSMFAGYFDADDNVGALDEGFFLTGDLGRLDDRGAVHLHGRLKLLIDVGGVKVNPYEVEEVIRRHPDVGDCVALPAPVSHTVSRVRVIVTPGASGRRPDPEAVRAFARQRLSPHKAPRLVEVRDSLPKSPTGKILRQQIDP